MVTQADAAVGAAGDRSNPRPSAAHVDHSLDGCPDVGLRHVLPERSLVSIPLDLKPACPLQPRPVSVDFTAEQPTRAIRAGHAHKPSVRPGSAWFGRKFMAEKGLEPLRVLRPTGF